MASYLVRMARARLAGISSQYRLAAADEPVLGRIASCGLYLHVPFCRTICPYCPYFKVVYDSRLAARYAQAMLAEIEMIHRRVGRLAVSSIYIGGGTPTLCMDELGVILDRIRDRFDVRGDVCIETAPTACDAAVAEKLKRFGVSLVSLGIQSFNDKYLSFLGRGYGGDVLRPIVRRLVRAGFKSVNADLMFAMPGQSCGDLLDDLSQTVSLGIDQVTMYPLFTFPHASVAAHLRAGRVRTPGLWRRRRQFRLISAFFAERGFVRSSIWSFRRPGAPKYSSATRDSYIGLGAGACSHTPAGMFLNTFSVEQYIARCLAGRFPTALAMEFSDEMQKFFWLYWRLYETKVGKDSLHERFGRDDEKLARLLRWLRIFGWLRDDNGCYSLNDTGAFWVHLMQNHFILDYINKVWSVATKDPWPKEIVL